MAKKITTKPGHHAAKAAASRGSTKGDNGIGYSKPSKKDGYITKAANR